ncbi:MAG: hypothetical protein HOO96_41825 [Polyangiaceae bacterium]|nr:hypothetical protein [Polyangiaceae bacterium]
MGQSVIVACEPSWEVAAFRPIFDQVAGELGVLAVGDDTQLELREQDIQLPFPAILYADADDAGYIEDYATNELLDPVFRQQVVAFRFFTIMFHSLEATRRLLELFAVEAGLRGERAWFDTDYGWVIDARHFLRELEQNPHWDWRFLKEEP